MTVPPIVTFTTDFGEGSPYVAAMKAIVLDHCPAARLVDISHSVPPFDVDAGAFLLWAGARHFPPGSVHVAVVDPGVGTARRPLALLVDGSRFVGPDNGVFDTVLQESAGEVRAVMLARPAGASPTFEGRDVFAPAAGDLAAGVGLGELGAPVEVQRGAVPAAPRVVWVDGFGNLVLSLGPPARPLRVGGVEVREVARTFGEAPAGAPFCYLGSLGRLEIGVREGRADAVLGVGRGAAVEELPPP